VFATADSKSPTEIALPIPFLESRIETSPPMVLMVIEGASKQTPRPAKSTQNCMPIPDLVYKGGHHLAG
jgi:hypothetical protein